MCVNVARPSGLLVPFEVPELTMEQAIERNWVRREGGLLMEPKPDEYLPTYLLDHPWGFAPARIPWRDDYDFGPFIVGLPEL